MMRLTSSSPSTSTSTSTSTINIHSIIGRLSCWMFIFQLSLLLQSGSHSPTQGYIGAGAGAGAGAGSGSGSSADAFVPIQIAPRTRPPTYEYTRPRTAALNNKPSDMSEEEYEAAMEKATKAMTAFTNKYLQNTCTTLCTDKSVPAVVIKGLAEHKVTLGTPLCPCRFYENKEAEAKDGFWNCPCVPMRERHECHCMLFLTEDNAFAGEDQQISVDEVLEISKKLK